MRDQFGKVMAPYDHQLAQIAINDLVKSLDGKDDEWAACIRGFSDQVYASLSSDSSKLFIDKTPRYFLILPFLEKVYPDAKYIFLFRQPLAVMASIVKAWNYGRFMPCYQNSVDLYMGPRLLVDAWDRLKGKSIRISYEALVTDSDATLSYVMDYLGLPTEEMSSDLGAENPLAGIMGDKTGARRYNSVSTESLGQWAALFDSWYRRRYAVRYLEELGDRVIEGLGYDRDQLVRELKNDRRTARIGVRDAFDSVRVSMYHGITGDYMQRVMRKILVPGSMFWKRR